MTFRRATKRDAKARVALIGPAGSGKTWTALTLASVLGQRVAVLDTERGSASKYADLWEFDADELAPPYHPDRYIAAIDEAAHAGYDALVIDSLSHEWNGPGGVLALVDLEAAKARGKPDTFGAWRTVTPIHARLIDAIIGAPLHVIVTMRSKAEYLQDVDENGKRRITKVGQAPQQRDGVEFEFDIVAELDTENVAIVTKSRCPALSGQRIVRPGVDVAQEIAVWLRGAEVAPPEFIRQVTDWFATIGDKDRRSALKDDFARRFGIPDRLLAEQQPAVRAWMGVDPTPDPTPAEPAADLEAPFT